MIARKLGVSADERVNARSLVIREVPTEGAKEFLNTYHIQGAGSASVRLGLYDTKGSLRAVMGFRSRSDSDWELTRYATDGVVRGGFSKLFKAFVRERNPSSVVTFADRGVSDGGLYLNNGFVDDGLIAPDYKYVRNGSKREHKFNYRLKRFREDPKLKYVEGSTERELAAMNNLLRIYDAGKVRWVWQSDRIE